MLVKCTTVDGTMAMLMLLGVYPLSRYPFPLEDLNDDN